MNIADVDHYFQSSLVDYPKELCLCINTPYCTNTCFYCFNKELKNDDPLSFEVMKYGIDKNITFITAISLTGGEPLLNPYLQEIVDYAKSLKLKVKLDTSLIGDVTSLPLSVDLINVSIKNYNYLLQIIDKIKWIDEHDLYYEFNIVYHKDFLSDNELIKINKLLEQFNAIINIVEMDTSYCNLKNNPSKKDLVKACSFFSNTCYIVSRDGGREFIL